MIGKMLGYTMDILALLIFITLVASCVNAAVRLCSKPAPTCRYCEALKHERAGE